MDFKTTVMHAEVDTLGGTILKSGKAAILDGQGVEFLQLWQPPPFLPPPSSLLPPPPLGPTTGQLILVWPGPHRLIGGRVPKSAFPKAVLECQ